MVNSDASTALKLSVSAFVSALGSVLLILSISIKIYEQTNSNLLASSIIASQWALLIFFLPLLNLFTVKLNARALLIVSECAGMVITVGIGVFLPLLPVGGYILLMLRGFQDSMSKTSTSIYTKYAFDHEKLAHYNTLIESFRLIGASSGALLGLLLVNRLELFQVALIDSMTFLASALVASRLRNLNTLQSQTKETGFGSGVFVSTISMIRNHKALRYSFVFLCLTVLFQAYHGVGRIALPYEYLKTGEAGVVVITIVSTLGVSLGALSSTKLVNKVTLSNFSPALLILIPSACLLLSISWRNYVFSLAAYFLYMVTFEIGFQIFNTSLITECKAHQIGRIASVRSAVLPGLMFVTTLGLGWLTDQVGFLPTTIGFASTVIAVAYLYQLLNTPPQAIVDGSDLKER